MLKFILKSILFLLLLYILASLIQNYIDKGAAKTGLSNYQEWNDIVESKINADLLVQGSSKAWVQISPYILDSAFQLNSYNLGIDGYLFPVQYTRFQLYMKYNKKPDYIIQCLDCATLYRNKDLYMFEQFIPFLGESAVRKAVSNYDVFDFRDFFIPLYKYMHSFASKDIMHKAISANYNNETFTNGKYKGFMANSNPWDRSFGDFKRMYATGYKDSIDVNTKKQFENFLDFCKKEGIKVFLVYPPEYIEAQKLLLNREEFTTLFKEYSKTYNIPYLDYSMDSLCFDTINFYNSQHLNSLGVEKFNKILVEDLKTYIN